MTPERWRRVGELFQSALDQDSGERPAFLSAACGSDAELRQEVESLLAAHRDAGTFGELRPSRDEATLAEPPATRTLEPGARVGPYEVLDLIAAGGMGEVYRARDERLGRDVAVKVLPAASLADAGRLRRFHQEARAAGALNHPNILAVYDVGTEGAVPYVVSELLEGETLRERLTRDGPLPAPEAAAIAAGVAAGLVAAHEKGIVHRDLKPANLFLTRDGRVKVLDFGLAKRVDWPASTDQATSPTQPGVLLGTAGYMSPEQARGEPTGTPTDVFSFGAVLFEVLTGRRAFEAGSPVETLASILSDDPPFEVLPAEVPAPLVALLRRCLEKDPTRRFPSARELSEALASPIITAAAPMRRAAPADSVAVLPFLNLDPEQGQEYLCDGLAEELIHALASVEGLRVAARTSSFQFKGRSEGVRRIGERLGVTRVVEGSVRRVGTRLRITVQLIDAGSGYHVWSERFDRELGDVFALQDEIALRVVEALKVRLVPSLAPRAHPRDVQAYELYLKGRYFWNKRYQGELRKAIASFEAAIARDPEFAPAHAGLADASSVLGFYGLAPERECFARARQAAERALALDPRSPEAHVSMALVRDWFDWDLAGAERALRRALELSPDHVPAHVYLTHVLCVQDRPAEALASARAGVERDPLSPLAHTLVSMAHYFAGDDAGAAEAAAAGLELDSSYPAILVYLALAESRRGRHEAALSAARRGSEAFERAPFFESLVGWTLARAGDADGARAVLASLSARAAAEYVPAVCLARVAAALGDRARALGWLEEAIGQRNTWVVNLGVDPWPGVADDPRWHELLTRAGLPRMRPLAVRAAGRTASATPGPSVAVLPFRDLSADLHDDHLGLGLADATITELARMGSLLVRPTSAVLRYAGGGPEPQEAGRQLAVDTVVEGSFQRAGERIRVTVQLLDVRDGRPIWGTKVDTSLSDVFGMQDEVSSRIAQALRVELAPRPGGHRSPRPPSAGAYALYMKGKLALWRESLADCIAAVDWFEKAREADPAFALAWAGLADAYVRIAFEFQPEGDWYARAEAMCERALALDSELPEARYVRARLVWSPPGGFDHERGMRELVAALAGRPSLDDAHVRMGVILFHVGMIDEAQAALERALALSPEHLVAMGHVASCHFHRGDFARARDVVDAVARQNPSYWHQNLAGQSRVRLGDVEGAAAVADQMIAQGEERIARAHGLQALVAARRGHAARALGHVEQAVASRKSFGHYHHVQYDIACVHALLGDAGEALRWLREASANGYPCHPFFALDPLLDGVRADPAFAAWLDAVRREDERYARLYAELAAGAPWNRRG